MVTPHVVYFALWHAKIYQHYGRLLKYALRLQDEKPTKEMDLEIATLCQKNGWDYMSLHYMRNTLFKFPKAYKPF